jgi:hypothetical protein
VVDINFLILYHIDYLHVRKSMVTEVLGLCTMGMFF